MRLNQSAAQWFASAEYAYAEQHQACAWCGDVHCVRQSCDGGKRTFSCQRCDFQVDFDAKTNRHHLILGEEQSPCSETMLEQPIANLI